MKDMPQGMTYTVLRGIRSQTQGVVRTQSLPEGLQFFLRAEGLPVDRPLRLLLVSSGEEGAALDLGRLDVSAQGTAGVCGLFPEVELRLWDAAVLVEDWPSGRLVAAAWLWTSTGPVWCLAEAAARYLNVPSGLDRALLQPLS